MKKFFFSAIVVIAFAVGTVINANLNNASNNKNDLLLNNVDAMASCEVTRGSSVKLSCSGSGTCSTTYMGYTLTCDGHKN